LKAYIDQHRDAYGVEPICKVLQIAPSCYRRHAAQIREPQLRCDRAKHDDELIPQVQRVWQTNMQVYGADKVWKQMNREGIAVARCTVERLMRRLGLRGVRRGKVVRTTTPDANAPCPLDRVNRQFKAQRPNQLWVSDFTYVSTWHGWQYVAFVIDVYARRIVGLTCPPLAVPVEIPYLKNCLPLKVLKLPRCKVLYRVQEIYKYL
jgi:putative transposase